MENMENFKFLSGKQIDALSIYEKEKYYYKLKSYSLALKYNKK